MQTIVILNFVKMHHMKKKIELSLISNFRHVLNVVCFLLVHTYLSVKMEQTECSETLAYKLQTLRNYPEENIPNS
jgi:hypothetical protein